MRNLAIRVLVPAALAAAALAGCASPATTANVMAPGQSERVVPIGSIAETFAALQRGGNLLVMRHGATNREENDDDPAHPDNCARNRSLSDTGRLNASGWGKVLRAASVPVQQVYASRYCRCVETAERLELAPITKSTDLTAAAGMNDTEQERRGAGLRALLREIPAGSNIVAVTHSPNLVAAFGTDLAGLGEADAAVLQPTPTGWRVVGYLPIRAVSAYAHANDLLSRGVAHASPFELY
jgi:broad specificity phosphatase PhoE